MKTALVENFEQHALSSSGITQTENYKQYDEMKKNNLLDEEGYYDGAPHPVEQQAETDVVDTKGSVHVSLARNAYLTVNYYLDPEFTQKLEVNECWIDPGDSIYASEPYVTLENSRYRFKEFKITEYGADSSKESTSVISDSGEVLHLPEDYTGTEISIVPAGEFVPRILKLTSYVDENGIQTEISLPWKVNNKRTTSKEYQVSSSIDYTVICDYDETQYYVIPNGNNFIIREDDGTVHFKTYSPQDDFSEFEVKLHKWLSLFVDSKPDKRIAAIKVNGVERGLEKGTLTHLKCGDKIIVETIKNTEYTNPADLVLQNSEKTAEGYRYTYTVAESAQTNMQLIPKGKADSFVSLSIDNAVCEMIDASNNKVYKDNESIANDTKVTIKIIPDSGYYIPNNKDNMYEKTMKYSEYLKKRDSIIKDNTPQKYIVVNLETKDDYGKVTYLIDKKETSGTATLKEGQKIILKYELTDDNAQFVKESGGGLEFINNLFKSKKEEVTITVGYELDGQTIKREDYINVMRKGE